MNFGTFKDNF